MLRCALHQVSSLTILAFRHTMTTKIRFADVIKVIKVFLNFHPDSFPIILSFENHCSVPYQEVMARLLVDILGERLYVPTEASLFGRLPSPLEYVYAFQEHFVLASYFVDLLSTLFAIMQPTWHGRNQGKKGR